MAKSFKSKTCCIVDLGYFVSLAETLAPSFGRTLYYSPGIECSLPKINSQLIGKGIPGVERIDEIWSHLDEIDLFVFPDVGSGPLQEYLRKIGKRVWGSAMAETLEFDRVGTKKILEEVGVPIYKWDAVKGIEALREFLQHNKDRYVKVSRFRGNVETFYAKSLNHVEQVLRKIEYNLGSNAKSFEFIIEKAIHDCIEIAYDGFTIDGQFPNASLAGIEIKGQSYVGRWRPYGELPQQIQDTNGSVSTLLEKYKCRSFFGMEMRIDKHGKPWVLDPLTRFGSPPGEVCQLIYKNLAEIFWYGADGELVDPEPAGEWATEIIIRCEDAQTEEVGIIFPDEIAANVKLRNVTVIDGKRRVMPQTAPTTNIGAVCAVGATMEEAIAKAKEYADKVESDGGCLDICAESLDKAAEEIKKLESYGVKL